MKLTREEVAHIAELAKLSLTDAEQERFSDQLSAILDYADRIQAIGTADIPPTANVLPVDTVLRDDEAKPGLPREKLLQNAPETEDGMFKVDVILD